MGGLGEAEAPAKLSFQQRLHPTRFLVGSAKIPDHHRCHQIAHDGGFVLQVVVQTEPLARQIFPNARHGKIGAILPPKLLRQRVPEVSGSVCSPAHLPQQCLPIFSWQTLSVPIRPGMLAAMIEETDVVVLCFQRFDFALNEIIEHQQVVLDGAGNFKKKGFGHVSLAQTALCICFVVYGFLANGCLHVGAGAVNNRRHFRERFNAIALRQQRGTRSADY